MTFNIDIGSCNIAPGWNEEPFLDNTFYLKVLVVVFVNGDWYSLA